MMIFDSVAPGSISPSLQVKSRGREEDEVDEHEEGEDDGDSANEDDS